jgi:hypothetical protein
MRTVSLHLQAFIDHNTESFALFRSGSLMEHALDSARRVPSSQPLQMAKLPASTYEKEKN